MQHLGSMEISNIFQVPSVHVCLWIVTWRKMSFLKIWCTNCRYDKNNILPGGESIWESLTHFSTTQIPPNLCPNLLKTLENKGAQGWEIWLNGGDVTETWPTAGSRPPYREGPRGGGSISPKKDWKQSRGWTCLLLSELLGVYTVPRIMSMWQEYV